MRYLRWGVDVMTICAAQVAIGWFGADLLKPYREQPLILLGGIFALCTLSACFSLAYMHWLSRRRKD